MSVRVHTIQDALDQLRPKLDAYRDGHLSLDEITTWLSSYEAELPERDATWEDASRRIWALLSGVESRAFRFWAERRGGLPV
jgi:hypothetical protein